MAALEALSRLCAMDNDDLERITAVNQITDELLLMESRRYGGPSSVAPRDVATCHACRGRIVAFHGEMVCETCARVKSNFMDRTVESRGAFDDSRRTPVERCGMPIDPLLPRSSMTTFVHVEGRGNKAMYNYKRTSARNRVDSKERPCESVFQVYNTVASAHNVSPAILLACKEYYKSVSSQKISRGNQKAGVIAACMHIAFEVNDSHRTHQQIATMFNTTAKNVIAGINTIYTFLHLSVSPVTPLKHVVTFARALGLAPHHIAVCETLCRRIAMLDSLLNTYTPQSLAAGIILWACQSLGLAHARNDVAAATGVSVVTISKCFNAMANIADELRERVAVRLAVREDGTVAAELTVV